MVQRDKTHMLMEVADVSSITSISCFSDSCSSTRDACCNGLRANSLNAIKILANLLIAIDPTCHRQKKSLQCHLVAFKELTKISMAFRELTHGLRICSFDSGRRTCNFGNGRCTGSFGSGNFTTGVSTDEVCSTCSFLAGGRGGGGIGCFTAASVGHMKGLWPKKGGLN